jgi:hypothetical protein
MSKYNSVTFRTNSGTQLKGLVLSSTSVPTEVGYYAFNGLGKPNESGKQTAFFKSEAHPGVLLTMAKEHLKVLAEQGNMVKTTDGQLIIELHPPKVFCIEDFISGSKPSAQAITKLITKPKTDDKVKAKPKGKAKTESDDNGVPS